MSDAMDGLALGRNGNKREQEILTPQSITDCVRAMFGNRPIALDPCAARETFGRDTIRAERVHYGIDSSDDGLKWRWADRTYVNPPYNELKTWLAKAVAESRKYGRTCEDRIVVLCPVRPNRSWWRAARNAASAVVELDPVCFVGFEKGTVDPKGQVRKAHAYFPAPLCLLCFNVSRDAVRAALREHPVGELVSWPGEMLYETGSASNLLGAA